MQVITKKQSKVIAVVLALTMLLSCFSVMQGSVYAASSKKSPYKKGDNIKNAVFYIAVDADGNGKITDNGDAVYYYTYKDIQNVGEEVEYRYNNHDIWETAHVRGAKLSTLLENLEGVDIQDSWIIQYMSEDAYQANETDYQDRVKGLTDANGDGNMSGAPIAAETIIGYESKLTFDTPDEYNVNETVYTRFLDYEREASPVRGYRQTRAAGSAVMKLLTGVVITNDSGEKNLPNGHAGYTLESIDASGDKIADDYEMMGYLEGMAWPAKPYINVPWATVNTSQSGNWNGSSKIITIGADTSQKVSFKFTETPFFTINENGTKTSLNRSNMMSSGYEFPTSNVIDGVEYEYFGYDKPMYIRYQGIYLKEFIDDLDKTDKVYVVSKDGKAVDITDKIGGFFVACYYTQSKKSSNIANQKRTPLNYSHAALIDTASAPIEYSNDSKDYTPASAKVPTVYSDADVVIISQPATVAGLKASLTKYNSIKASWNKVSGAAGYKVYYKTGNGKWKTKDTKKTSITLAGLTKGKEYQIKVKAYNTVEKVTLYSSSYSAVKKATTLKAPTLKVKKTKKKAKITFTNIKGESGYQVYQKIGKNSWKKVKTLKTNKTSWTSKNLKKGKTYSYKVRAYKTVDGKKIYGPWSSVKKIKR